jgi:hypothetical protein
MVSHEAALQGMEAPPLPALEAEEPFVSPQEAEAAGAEAAEAEFEPVEEEGPGDEVETLKLAEDEDLPPDEDSAIG